MKATICALGLVLLVLGDAAPAADVGTRLDARRQAPRHPTLFLSHRHTVDTSTIRVHDGDTFYTGTETIRLRGIDTPELGGPGGRAAAIRLRALLHEGPVTIVPRAQDVYGRTVADVYVGGRDVAGLLRREGFGKPRGR
jgi:endonuclease YncB( thermonuclease family)